MPQHHGGANGGGAYHGEVPPTQAERAAALKGASFSKKTAIAYGTSNEVFSVSSTASVSAPSGAMPKMVEVKNDGDIPLTLMVGYKTYSAEDAIADSGETRYLHTMIMPGEVYYPALRAVVSTVEATAQFDGTALDNDAPSSVNSGLLWTDITADLGADVDATTDPITITTAADHTGFFRVGDLIQIGRGTSQTDLEEANHYREILRVQSITNATTMVCERALYGTDAGDNDSTNWNQGHTSGFPIFLPFFNAYHDVDKYSVAQTDANGKFKSFNFFGQGRATAGEQGLVPGSIAIKFYNAGYQSLGLSGIAPSTNSGLSAGTNYAFDIQVDGGTNFDNLTFTTDTSNVNFGGTNGIISKIQDALDTQFYTAGNLFEKAVSVGIVNGDIRFTSGSRLSTSAIAITVEDGSDASFLGTGRIPALANVPDAVAARLPDDVSYDRVTYATSAANVFCYDDGFGKLQGMCSGTINYETGAIDMVNCPRNAEFVYSVSHTSAFSGKHSDATTTIGGAMVNILANCPTQKRSGELTVTAI